MNCPTCNKNMELLFVNFHCWDCEKKPITKEAFNLLSDRDKRISIAKDVLSLLTARKIKPTFCVYLQVSSEGWMATPDLRDEETITEIKGAEQCHVCALGGLFLASLEHYSIEKAGTRHSIDNVIRSFLSSFFSTYQLWLIETAFEKALITPLPRRDDHEPIGEYRNRQDKEVEKAIKFAEDVYEPEERLMAIMQNIIDHGEFIPDNSGNR